MRSLIFTLLLICTVQAIAQDNLPYKILSRTHATAAIDPALGPFYHGVASGDPLENAVIIWTRVTPATDENVTVNWFVCTDVTGEDVVRSGSVGADAQKDYTIKVDVTGLSAGTTYFYYFSALGKVSIIGRTKTLPAGAVDHLKFAVVSCNNYDEGFFNGFARIAERNDLDAVVHLGDYIYEYGTGGYGDTAIGRTPEPSHEIVEVGDYRRRYSIYRLDPDLRRAHQQHSFITVWDDHESANDAWEAGAQNHNPLNVYTIGKVEGLWETRKRVAKQAYFEWMPIRDNAEFSINRKLRYGTLAEFFMVETRLQARTKQPVSILQPDFDDPKRTMLGSAQKSWLIEGLKNSTSQWKVIGNQVMFSQFNIGFAANPPTNLDSIAKTENQLLDIWDGYPAERAAIIDSLELNKINNAIFLSGDIHASFAYDVTKQPVQYPVPAFNNIPQPSATYTSNTGAGAVAVEFVTPSITSDNFDEILGTRQSSAFELVINKPLPQLGGANYNPHMKYVDLDRNGYFILDLKADSAQADYYYVAGIKRPTREQAFAGTGVVTRKNENHLRTNITAASPKNIQDPATPLLPAIITGAVKAASFSILSVFPNPAADNVSVTVGMAKAGKVSIQLVDINGHVVKQLFDDNTPALILEKSFNLSTLPSGTYTLKITVSGQSSTRKLIVK